VPNKNNSSGASAAANATAYRPSYALVPRYLRERMMDDKRIVEYREHGPYVNLIYN
jgi:hypothetical protein